MAERTHALLRRPLFERRPRPLAVPPPGSGLHPVLGAPGLPFLGQTVEFLREPYELTARLVDTYGPIHWMRFAGRPFVHAIGPDATEEILVNRDKAYLNGPAWSHFIGPFFRRGLLLLDGEEHLHHRRIMQQAFTAARLPGYAELVAGRAAKELPNWPTDRPVPLFPLIKRLMLDVAGEMFLGDGALDSATAARVNRAFIDTVRAGLAVVRRPVPGGRWARGLAGRAVLEEYFRSQLPLKKRESEGADLFTALCQARTEEGERFTDQEIVDHMIFVLMAAHDTVTITATTMAYYLAKNPAWQERLREESVQVATGSGDLSQLTALDWVMKESLRLVPPVPGFPRCTVRDTALQGHHIPAGTMVVAFPRINHILPSYWPNPQTFDPSRFTPTRHKETPHRYAWTPFGGGVHKCIGLHVGALQVKAVMHQLLLHHAWSVSEGYEWRLDHSTLPKPKDGLPVRLTKV